MIRLPASMTALARLQGGPRRAAARQSREGIALPVTLWALVIAGAFLTVATFVGFHEQRAAANGRRLRQALTQAESRLPDVLGEWTPGRLNRRLPRQFDSLVAPGSGAAVIRFGNGLYLHRADGIDTGTAGASRAAITVVAGQLLTVRPTAVAVRAALTARDTVMLGVGSRVSGSDTPPPGWLDCPPGDSGLAGVDAVFVAGGVIDGLPPVNQRQYVDTLETLYDTMMFDSLAAQVTLPLSPGKWQTPPRRIGQDCPTGLEDNWGDPADPQALCGGYFPIIHVTGDLTLLGGEGQGILLVDGNLEFAGDFRFYGLVFVRGRITVPTVGASVVLRGAVVTFGVGFTSQPADGVEVTFSKCIIDRVLLSSGRLIPARSRSWKELFEVP